MRSIAVMDIFDQFCCVCIEGDPRQGSAIFRSIRFLLACVVFLSVCGIVVHHSFRSIQVLVVAHTRTRVKYCV